MIEQILSSIKKLPAFPAVVQKVTRLLEEGDYTPTDVARLIGCDPSMAANIIKTSNSAYFGARAPVKTISDAVVFLGQKNLLRIVQTAGISKFYQKDVRGYVTRASALWEHSVAVALMSQVLSRKIRQKEDQVLYTAALLHDVGKLVMGEFVSESFSKISELVTQRGYDFLEAEEEVIGINHADLGGRIAEHWHFPRELQEAIAYHHRPDLLEGTEKDGDMIPWLVYLADQASLMMGMDGGKDGLAYRGLGEVLKKFNMRTRDLEISMVQMLEDLRRAQDLLNLVP